MFNQPQYQGMPQYNPYQYQPQYNPYQQQPMQQPVQQSQQQQAQSLVGRMTNANENIPVSDVPTNGTPAYFPMQDGSAILVKSWQPDGTIRTIKYVPDQQPVEPQASVQEDILTKLNTMEQSMNTIGQAVSNLTDSLTK